jgi:hypothetical protein
MEFCGKEMGWISPHEFGDNMVQGHGVALYKSSYSRKDRFLTVQHQMVLLINKELSYADSRDVHEPVKFRQRNSQQFKAFSQILIMLSGRFRHANITESETLLGRRAAAAKKL